MIRIALAAAIVLATTSCEAAPAGFAPTDRRAPIRLDRIIPLPDVKGRIDHLAFDPQHGRLLVAEHDNGSVDDVDLSAGPVPGPISRPHHPPGAPWLAAPGDLPLASAAGSVPFYP